MGGGFHGGFGNTFGSKIAAGSISFMDKDEQFIKNITNRKDIDPDGILDVIGHGTLDSFQIINNGVKIYINSKQLAKLIKKSGKSYKKGIRLLSCDTGKDPKGFAQNLANKLGVTVYAPNKLLWAEYSGTYYVAERHPTKRNLPDKSKKGKFIAFKPGGNIK